MNKFKKCVGKIIKGISGKIVGDADSISEKKRERFKQRQYRRYGVSEKDFVEGMCVVNIYAGKGHHYETFMKEDGTVWNHFKFRYAQPFNRGLARVELKNGDIVELDKNGNLWNTKEETYGRNKKLQEVEILKRLYTKPSEFQRLATKWFENDTFIDACKTQIKEGLIAKVQAGKVGKDFENYLKALKERIDTKIKSEKARLKVIEAREAELQAIKAEKEQKENVLQNVLKSQVKDIFK